MSAPLRNSNCSQSFEKKLVYQNETATDATNQFADQESQEIYHQSYPDSNFEQTN
jgi:hypothetical protein